MSVLSIECPSASLSPEPLIVFSGPALSPELEAVAMMFWTA